MRWLHRVPVPRASWAVYHPGVRRVALHPSTKLLVKNGPRVSFIQTHVHPSALQRNVIRWGAVLAVTSAAYQFLTNLHTVPITGRTQVVVLTNEEECELGTKAATDDIQKAKLVKSGPRYRMCVDIAARLVSVSEHLFPREYDWRISLVEDATNANASCYPGGKIVIYTGILDMVDFAVEKGICKSKHDALAVILSHEIGHALARHTAESMSYLPLMCLQMILGLESPLLQYVFQFAFNLPFSRKQETEADHIGLMLMASACYDPTEAPRLWHAFGRFQAMLGDDGEGSSDDDDGVNFDLDFYSTHPSNYKRERRLESLVEEALTLQKKSSWCFSLKEKVQQLVNASSTESDLLNRINIFQRQQRVARRNTLGTIHELENKEVFKMLREEQEKELQQAEAS